jgi:hypothetical protein
MKFAIRQSHFGIRIAPPASDDLSFDLELIGIRTP